MHTSRIFRTFQYMMWMKMRRSYSGLFCFCGATEGGCTHPASSVYSCTWCEWRCDAVILITLLSVELHREDAHSPHIRIFLYMMLMKIWRSILIILLPWSYELRMQTSRIFRTLQFPQVMDSVDFSPPRRGSSAISSWSYHWVCTAVCNLHVFAVVQICGVLCFEAGACDLIRWYEDSMRPIPVGGTCAWPRSWSTYHNRYASHKNTYLAHRLEFHGLRFYFPMK